MFAEKIEIYTPDANTEILANKDGLKYFYHTVSRVVTICDEEENCIIMQKGFGSKKSDAVSWVDSQ